MTSPCVSPPRTPWNDQSVVGCNKIHDSKFSTIFILHVAAHLVFMDIFLNPKFSSGAVCGVYLSIETNSLTGRNISHFTLFDLGTPLSICKAQATNWYCKTNFATFVFCQNTNLARLLYWWRCQIYQPTTCLFNWLVRSLVLVITQLFLEILNVSHFNIWNQDHVVYADLLLCLWLECFLHQPTQYHDKIPAPRH